MQTQSLLGFKAINNFGEQQMTEVRNCFKCGIQEGIARAWITGKIRPVKIIPHHLSYNPEIIVDCCLSCHKKIHIRIRKEDKCPLSIEDAKRLSTNSSRKRYFKNNIEQIIFTETTSPNIQFQEHIYYNKATGHIRYGAWFIAQHGKELLIFPEAIE